MIYLPEMVDKIKDTIEGLKGNWQDYEAHKAAMLAFAELFGAEYGKNANGEWVRFNFGLQICWHYFGSVRLDIDDLNAGIYRSELQEHAFPVPFIETPAIAVSQSTPGNYGTWLIGGCSQLPAGLSQWRYRAFCNTSATDVNIQSVGMIAIGWWKTPDNPAEWSEE